MDNIFKTGESLKRILALALAFVLVLGYIPAGVSAEEATKTVYVGVIEWITNYVPEIHYWNNSGLAGDVALTATEKTVSAYAGSGYWSDNQTFHVYTAEIPAAATNMKTWDQNTNGYWAAEDEVCQSGKMLLLFEWGGTHHNTTIDCPHPVHGTDGNCVACGASVGHSYDSTGLCGCGLQAEALVNGNTYTTFADAVQTATNGSTIKLLANVTAGTVVCPDKPFNLDLNGKTLTVDGFYTPGAASMWITDSSSAKDGKIVGPVYVIGYLTLEHGTIEGTVYLSQYGANIYGSFTMNYGAIQADTDIFINNDGVSVSLEEGEFPGGIKIANNSSVTAPMTLADTLVSYCRFYQNGTVVDMSQLADPCEITGTVTVETHVHNYSSTTGLCGCGDECPHTNKTNGVCDTCGMADAHTHEYVNGECSCGNTADVTVTYNSVTKYYATIGEALATLNASNKGAVVTLMNDITVDGNVSAADTYAQFTLELNGYTLTADELHDPTSNGMTIQDSSAAQTGAVDAQIWVSGPTTIKSGTYKQSIQLSTSGGVYGRLTVKGGTFTAATDFLVANDNCKITLEGGTFTGGIKMERNGEATSTILSDFVSGSYKYMQNSAVVDMTNVTDTITGDVTVLSHASHSFDTSGYCSGCGAQAIASVTKDGNTSYYTTEYYLEQALTSANAGCTVQLLQDFSCEYFSSQCGYYLDLNGHTLTASQAVDLPLSSGATIMDTSAEQDGKIVGTVYAAYSTALVSGTIEGTVSFPQKASSTGYSFRVEGGAINAATDFAIHDKYVTIELTGGTFPGGISILSGGDLDTPKTLADCISGSYRYFQNGNVVTLTEGQTEITGGDVTVASYTPHTHDYGTTGTCSCGDTMAIQVTIGSQVSFFNDLDDALLALENTVAADNAEVKLLKDLEDVSGAETYGGVYTLNLNGKNIVGAADNYGSVLGFCDTTVTIKGGGSVQGAYGTLHVDVKAHVTIDGTTFSCGSSNGVSVNGSGKLTVSSGTIDTQIYSSNFSGGDAPTIEITGTASVEGLNIGAGTNVTISGGAITGKKAINIRDNAKVTINGGSIDGTEYELYYDNADVVADVTINKASFPNDLVTNAPVLNQILGENAMYYKGSQTVKPLDTDTKITGAVTVDAHSHFASYHYYMVQPTCTEDGRKSYYLCEGCGKKFEDRECTQEITDLTIPAEGHFFNYDDNGFCNKAFDGQVCGGYEKPEGEGTEASPYIIDNAGKLFWFAAVVNGGYEDTNGNSAAWATVTEEITIPEGKAWTPISNYTGTFDGGSKTISGMHCASDAIYVGMFSRTGKCTIQNVYLADSSFESTDVRGSVGAIAGYAGETDGNSTVISNCSISNTTVTGYTAGGIAGTLYGFSEIHSSYPDCTVNAEHEGGGAVGRCHSGSYIEWVSAQGTVTGNYAGGVVGYVYNDAGPNATRSNGVVLSTFVGSVGGESTMYAGGIIGYVSDGTKASINNCSVKCSVTAKYDVNSRACGLLGHSNNDTAGAVTVSNSFTVDTTLGVDNINKASLASGGVTVTNCYSDDASNPLVVTGRTTDCAKKTDEQFKSGEVAYLLDAPQSTHVWGQNIDNGNPNYGFPVRGQYKVYQVVINCVGALGYSNYDVAITDHDDVNYVERQASTCQTEGTAEHWNCDSCGKNYANEECTTELTDEELTLPKADHNYDENGFCINKTKGVVCDAYEPAVLVTAENCTELGLKEDYIGYYAIGNAGQLYWFAEKVDNDNENFGSANAVLTADVKITSKPTGTRYWNPIGSADAKYGGSFDGNGKVIDDIYAGNTTADLVGLVAWLTEDGVVKNVTLIKHVIKGNDTVGAIVAYNEGTVEQCGNTGSVTGMGISVGGIVGVNAGTVRNCWNTGSITGEDVGGIVGDNEPGAKLENCWSTGEVTGSNSGSIVGFHQTGATVENCYTTQRTAIGTAEGTVSKVETKRADRFASGEVAYLLGGVWGQDLDNGKTVQTVPTFDGADVYYGYFDCTSTEAVYTNKTVSAEPVEHDYDNGFCEKVAGQTHYEPATLVTSDNYAELGLTEDYIGYYAITNAGQLYWFAEKVDNENATYGSVNVVLTDDITVNSGTVTAESTGLREWNPIGLYIPSRGEGTTISISVDGIFDGNGKTVSGMYFNDEEVESIALIANTGTNALVKNVTVSNSYFNGRHEIAGIVANNWGTVTGCINYATLSSKASVGGVVSGNTGTVELSGNAGSITSEGGAAAGIAGTTERGAFVRNCWNTADICAATSAGGIVGQTFSVVENCWSVGNVTDASSAGGIAGLAFGGEIRNCYTTASVFVAVGGAPMTDVETKSLAQFASGEVAYLLRTRAAEGTNVWGQDLDNGKPIQTVPTFDGAKVYLGYFSCTDTEAKFTNDSGVSPDPISHDWEYTANGAQITAECLNGCGTDGGKVTLIAPEDTVYDGDEKTVTVDGTLTDVTTLPQVAYEGDRVNVGTFTAKLTVGDATAQLPVEIAPYELEIQTFVPETKVYDGTTTCAIKSLTFVSTANGEELVLGTDFTAQLTFPDADAGDYDDAVLTLELKNTALASNYILKSDTVTGISHSIDPATITVTDVQVQQKVYDGTTDATITGVTISGNVPGDNVSVDAVAVFEDKNSGENKTLNLTFTLAGNDAGNYVLADDTGTATGKITVKPLEEIMEPVKDLTVDNVTSDDKQTLEEVKEELEFVLTDEGLSDEQRKEREDALSDVQDMLDRIQDAADAIKTDPIIDTKDITAENITFDDREDVEQALEDLYDALDQYENNYTDDEQEGIHDDIQRLEDALAALKQVEDLIKDIEELPDEVQPDTDLRDDILDAKDRYDELTDNQKELIPDELVQKLNDLLSDLKVYLIIKGDGQTWSEGELSFTANGPFETFVELKIDGNTVAAANYTAVSGSTVLTIKESYAETLTAGKHSISFVYPDGQAVGSFTVVIPTNGSAGTGDDAPIMLLAVLMSVSLAGAVMLLQRKRKV